MLVLGLTATLSAAVDPEAQEVELARLLEAARTREAAAACEYAALADLCGQLELTPNREALLDQLLLAVRGCPDAQLKDALVAAYSLGRLVLGQAAQANQGVDHLRGRGSAYLRFATPAALQQDCPACAATGKVPGDCAACKGDARCPHCQGRGHIALLRGGRTCANCNDRKPCPTCNETGRVVDRSTRTRYGRADIRTECPACNGSRRTGDGHCKACAGTGQAEQACAACRGDGRALSTVRAEQLYHLLIRHARDLARIHAPAP